MENRKKQLEMQVMKISEDMVKARDCYYNDEWLSGAIYEQIFTEKIKELKKAIDDAIKENVL